MKKVLPLVVTILILLACAPFGQPTAPAGLGVETIVAMTLEALTAVPPVTMPPPPASTQPDGTAIAYKNVSFILPTGLATNALAGTVPTILNDQQGAPWEIAPEYVKFQLDGYALYGTFHTPQILVYPAQEFANMNESAARNITQLQDLLSGAAAPAPENLPSIPFFNAGQVFAAQIQITQFQGGSGVRFLAVYGQYYATANNHDLFYQFQGLTNDGKYYIIAILPASHPLLAADEKPETIPPAGGIPFPGYDSESALVSYYAAVDNLLNSAAPESFNPTLETLDALIQSISIVP